MFWFLIYIQIINKIYSLEPSIGWAFIGRSSCGLSGFSRRSCRYSLGGTVAPQVPQGGVAGIHWAEQWRSQRLLKAELQVLIGRNSGGLSSSPRRSRRYSFRGKVAVSVAPQGGVASFHWAEQWRSQGLLKAEWQVFIGRSSGGLNGLTRRSRRYSLGRAVAISSTVSQGGVAGIYWAEQ